MLSFDPPAPVTTNTKDATLKHPQVLRVAVEQRVHLKFRPSVVPHHQREHVQLPLDVRLPMCFHSLLEGVDGVLCGLDFDDSIAILDPNLLMTQTEVDR